MQRDKTPTKATHHSSGGRKVPVSGAARAAAKPMSPRAEHERGEVMRARADAETGVKRRLD
jgi:hypothetical protein